MMAEIVLWAAFPLGETNDITSASLQPEPPSHD